MNALIHHVRLLVTPDAPDICLVYSDADYALLQAGKATPFFVPGSDDAVIVQRTPAKLIHFLRESEVEPA